MDCPKCSSRTLVVDTRDHVWRRRECQAEGCKHRFYTQEVVVASRPSQKRTASSAPKKAPRETSLKNVMSTEDVKRAAAARRAVEERRDAAAYTGLEISRRTFGIR